MPESTTISGRVLDALVTSGAITADQLSATRATAADDSEAGRSLLDRGLITEAQLAVVLEDELGFPRVDLESYAPDDEALALVPGDLARAARALPLFEIEGTLTAAVGDPADIFGLDGFGAQLGVQMDAVLADAPAVVAAIDQYFVPAEPASPFGADIEPLLPAPGMVPAPQAEPEPERETELEISAADFFDLAEDTPIVLEAPTEEAAAEPAAPEEPVQTVADVVESEVEVQTAIDLDVLAVADERKVAVLVSEILEQAVQRGASRIHLLPYKTDFFLVFRIKGRLEKIASAPLSMQPPLIDGLKSYAKLSGVASNRPALGRMHAEIAGKPVVLTVSSVPTVAGQRLVISIAAAKPQPRDLSELGMAEAESRALYAMVERGRGLLLIASPVSGGRSSTYYALLQHAAQVGKTVYSVERSVEYEIPAVAQVLVNPGQAVGASSYFAAGMRQDTDVMAIDGLQTAEDVHLAIEAAGLGKLVIATFTGADVVSAVARMLAMGSEPVSLASALTLGIGQRVVRTNCPSCSIEGRNDLTKRIPGAKSNMLTRTGAGCPNCGQTGFAGATAIFEVLPFTEPVRGVIASAGSADEIEKAARAAGMRPMIVSGLSKVEEGLVSPEELNRVMRFAQ